MAPRRARIWPPRSPAGAVGSLCIFAALVVCLSAASRPSAGADGRLGPAAGGCDFHVAPPPDGDDDAPGTNARPWATLEHAAAAVPDLGCTVWVRPGRYVGGQAITRRFAWPATFKSLEPYRAVLENDGIAVEIDGGRNIVLEGFEIRHSGPDADKYLVIVDRSHNRKVWSEDITLRNNIIHDSYHDDLLKIHNGVRNALVEGNLFYNQGENEQHIDVNSVTDVVIRDNVFFNDYAGSRRSDAVHAKHFIVIKDSNGNADGLKGSRRIAVRRNVFLSWEGGRETFVKVGNDGMAYHEARDVTVENNLLVGSSSVRADAAFGVRGAKDVAFVNNTIVGDLPSQSYGYRIHLKGKNPVNEDIRFVNNIWSDPTGTMGSDGQGSANDFSNGNREDVVGLSHHHNLYWNGGKAIPAGQLISPLDDDPHAIVADPGLGGDHSAVQLPRWSGTFASGSRTIGEELVRLVKAYGAVPAHSPAVDAADPAAAPTEDILQRRRHAPDLGAYEALPVAQRGAPLDAAGVAP